MAVLLTSYWKLADSLLATDVVLTRQVCLSMGTLKASGHILQMLNLQECDLCGRQTGLEAVWMCHGAVKGELVNRSSM